MVPLKISRTQRDSELTVAAQKSLPAGSQKILYIDSYLSKTEGAAEGGLVQNLILTPAFLCED
jgi:hypothetical protein